MPEESTQNQNPKQDTSSIQVDSDWKADAQAEKERLSAAEKKIEEKAEARKMPDPDFRGLLGILASQALMGLGMHQDPSGKGVMVDLDGSKFAIDLLDMLKSKTEGNLTEEETTEIKQLTQELQSRFVQIAQLVAAQIQEGNPEGAIPQETATPRIIDPTA